LTESGGRPRAWFPRQDRYPGGASGATTIREKSVPRSPRPPPCCWTSAFPAWTAATWRPLATCPAADLAPDAAGLEWPGRGVRLGGDDAVWTPADTPAQNINGPRSASRLAGAVSFPSRPARPLEWPRPSCYCDLPQGPRDRPTRWCTGPSAMPLAGWPMARFDNITERFGQRLRQLRKAAGLSQGALADKCRLDRTYISGIERGQRNVALSNLAVLAKALGVTFSELMEGL